MNRQVGDRAATVEIIEDGRRSGEDIPIHIGPDTRHGRLPDQIEVKRTLHIGKFTATDVDHGVVGEGHEGTFLDQRDVVGVVEDVSRDDVLMADAVGIAGGNDVRLAAVDRIVRGILAEVHKEVAFDMEVPFQIECVVAAA